MLVVKKETYSLSRIKTQALHLVQYLASRVGKGWVRWAAWLGESQSESQISWFVHPTRRSTQLIEIDGLGHVDDWSSLESVSWIPSFGSSHSISNQPDGAPITPLSLDFTLTSPSMSLNIYSTSPFVIFLSDHDLRVFFYRIDILTRILCLYYRSSWSSSLALEFSLITQKRRQIHFESSIWERERDQEKKNGFLKHIYQQITYCTYNI